MRESFAWDLLRSRRNRHRSVAEALYQQFVAQPTRCLGCGAFGCAFAADAPGWVFKLTADGREAAAAHAVATGLVRSPALPRVRGVVAIQRSRWTTAAAPWGYRRGERRMTGTTTYFVIMREDLADLPEALKSMWHRCVWPRHWLGHQSSGIGVRLPSRTWGNTRYTGGAACATRPAKMDTFLRRLDALVLGEAHREGLPADLADLHADNLGLRANGQVAIRDFGMSYWGDTSPFLAGRG